MRKVHPDKNGNNPHATLAQQNLVDVYESLKREREREREREIEDKREREKDRIRVEQREEKRKRENRDSYTSESYSDDSNIGSLLLKGFSERTASEKCSDGRKEKEFRCEKEWVGDTCEKIGFDAEKI